MRCRRIFIVTYFIVDEYYAILVNDDDDDELNISDIISHTDSLCNDKSSAPLEFVLSKRNQPQLLHNEFPFNLERANNDKKTWRCSKAHKTQCRARLTTIGSKLTVINDVHNHLI